MLRWRLLIGLVSILLLLLAVGGYSIALISRLEGDIRSILEANYESIRQAHNVRVGLLRMNAAYLRADIADVVAIGLDPLETRFGPNLERTVTALRLHARHPDEIDRVRQLSTQITDHLAALRDILALPPDAPDSQARYNVMRAGLLDRNLAITTTTEGILRRNEAAMLQAQARAQVVARDTIRFLVGAMLVALAVFLYSYYRLGRSLVGPIEHLTRSLDAVRAGHFEHTLPVRSSDELSRLAHAFNTMADELRAYRRDTDDTILRLNRSLRETIAAFPYPVLLLDAHCAIWVTNPAADTFLHGIHSPDHLPDPLRHHLDTVRRTQQNYLPEGPRDALLFRLGDREVHYLPRILRIFSPEGDFAGAAIILIDVTRFRWLDDMKTNLISTISHEIKTPLTGIRMVLHLLLEKTSGDLTPTQEEMVRAARDDGERLLTTLDALLDLSRLEAGRTQLDLQPTAPRPLLDQLRAAFKTQAETLGIALSVHAPADLPPVLVDAARLMHVLGNFTSNALKFAPRTSTVRLCADPAGPDYVRFSVIDEGPGVPEDLHAKIFDKFFRSPGHNADGVGLGLSIAREIVHAHDGRLGVQSTPHAATRFYCELPVAPR